MTTKDNGERLNKDFQDKFEFMSDYDNGGVSVLIKKKSPGDFDGKPANMQDILDFIKEVESQAQSRLRAKILEEMSGLKKERISTADSMVWYVKYYEARDLPSLSEAGDNGEGA